MERRDGRMCYEHNGRLFRAKQGVIEVLVIGQSTWQPWSGTPDEELARRLPDLIAYWDKDV